MMNKCFQFCKIAVDMGFITAEQLTVAIPEQIDDNLADKPHRFIGRILLENRLITNKEMYIVLNELRKAHD